MNNQFEFIGRITKDLTLGSYSDGKSVLDLPLAINYTKEDTLYITTRVFGKRADTINLYCKKGDLIGVRGFIRNNNWEDKEGNKHYDYQFVVSDLSFLQPKKKEQQNNEQKEISDNKINLDEIVIEDSDLPF